MSKPPYDRCPCGSTHFRMKRAICNWHAYCAECLAFVRSYPLYEEEEPKCTLAK